MWSLQYGAFVAFVGRAPPFSFGCVMQSPQDKQHGWLPLIQCISEVFFAAVCLLQLCWRPGGPAFAIVTADGQLLLGAAGEGAPSPAPGAAGMTCIAWSRNGAALVAGRGDEVAVCGPDGAQRFSVRIASQEVQEGQQLQVRLGLLLAGAAGSITAAAAGAAALLLVVVLKSGRPLSFVSAFAPCLQVDSVCWLSDSAVLVSSNLVEGEGGGARAAEPACIAWGVKAKQFGASGINTEQVF